MKLVTWTSFPKTFVPKVMLFLLGILISAYFSASTIYASGTQAASSEATDENYEENWWRSVRKGMWTWEGADWTLVKSALDRIEAATGKRRYEDKYDTIIDYGPGHWIYEWSKIGDEAHQAALKQEQAGDTDAARTLFLQASTYFTQGSYPHFREKHARDAITKAFENYRRAGKYFSVPMEEWTFEVDGTKFNAFIHFPDNHTKEVLPVILKTGGMDVLSTEFYPLSKVINNAGAAMIVYDSPGTGNDGVVDANYDKHHVAVLKRVLADKRFDNSRIGVWSESLAGVTAARIALGEHRKSIAAAVNSCGPIHALFAFELTGGIPEQFDIHELLKSYKNDELTKQQIDEFNQAMLSPPLMGMLIDFQGETFTDRIQEEHFNVLGILAKSLPVSLIEQGLVGKKNVTNTPLLTINTFSDPLVPQSESQLVTDASVQGKLMIYDNYGGHCVSRAEIPTIMQWLSYHLEL